MEQVEGSSNVHDFVPLGWTSQGSPNGRYGTGRRLQQRTRFCPPWLDFSHLRTGRCVGLWEGIVKRLSRVTGQRCPTTCQSIASDSPHILVGLFEGDPWITEACVQPGPLSTHPESVDILYIYQLT